MLSYVTDGSRNDFDIVMLWIELKIECYIKNLKNVIVSVLITLKIYVMDKT